MIRTILFVLLLSIPITYAKAQLLKYNNKQEILGAAAVSPDSGRQIIEKLVKECSQYGTSVQRRGDLAFKKWRDEHQALIDENTKIKQEIFSAKMTPLERQTANNMYQIQIPKMIDSQFKTISSAIASMPTKETKAQICIDYIRSVEDGKWDLKINDPVVFNFLQDRIAARNKNQKNDAQ